MARPRKFDEERALDAVMRVFWRQGYDATSTQDLCDATGLGRSSIYNTFSSKHELFVRALARYIQGMTTRQVQILEDGTLTAAERIGALFVSVLEGDLRDRWEGRSVGCLTVNSTVELAGRDPEVARMLRLDLERRLDSLRAVVSAGRRDGTITSPRDDAALARFLNAVIAGLRVSAQGGAGRAELEAVAATAMDALTGGPPDGTAEGPPGGAPGGVAARGVAT
ncbi:TetR/AcrR family transcriptional regulator [Streptomyces capparidis]